MSDAQRALVLAVLVLAIVAGILLGSWLFDAATG